MLSTRPPLRLRLWASSTSTSTRWVQTLAVRGIKPRTLRRVYAPPAPRFRVFSSSSSSSLNAQNTPFSSQNGNPNPETENDQKWIDLLESNSVKPWGTMTVPNPLLRLSISHGLLLQIIMYLTKTSQGASGPPEGDGGEFLSLFHKAQVPVHSEIGRARNAVSAILKGVVAQIRSVDPENLVSVSSSSNNTSNNNETKTEAQAQAQVSPEEHLKTVFALTDIIDALNVQYLGSALYPESSTTSSPNSSSPTSTSSSEEKMGTGHALTLPDWSEYWAKTEGAMVALYESLDKAGFALNEEMVRDEA